MPSPTNKAQDNSIRENVYRVIRENITSLQLAPGTTVSTQELAAKLQVSRTPVHDTFSRLEREKMLRPVPRGAVVPPLNTDMIRQTVWMHRTVSQAVLGELYNHRPHRSDPCREGAVHPGEPGDCHSAVVFAELH